MAAVGRPGWLGMALAILLAGAFAYLNAGERTTLELGFATLYRVSLVGLVFGAFLAGMITMFLAGLRQDLKTRRYLRGERAPERPWRADPPPDGPP